MKEGVEKLSQGGESCKITNFSQPIPIPPKNYLQNLRNANPQKYRVENINIEDMEFDPTFVTPLKELYGAAIKNVRPEAVADNRSDSVRI